MDILTQDVRHGLRSLSRQPTLTCVAVLTLALGIGANTAIFSVVYAALLRPLPFRDAGRLMTVSVAPFAAPGEPARLVPWPYPRFRAFRDAQQTFSDVAIYRSRPVTIAGFDEPERLVGELVSASYFPLLGVPVALGRTFLPTEDATPGAYAPVVLGDGVWKRRFGSDPGIVGRSVVVNERPHTVAGVLAPGFGRLTGTAEIWLPSTAAGAEDLAERAMAGVRLLESVSPASGAPLLPNISGLTLVGLAAIRLDGAVLVFMLGASVATGLLFGILPALQATRCEVAQSLHTAPTYRAGRIGTSRGRNALVVAAWVVAAAPRSCGCAIDRRT